MNNTKTDKDYIVKERTLQAPINRVWNAITNADEISKWFIEAEFKAEIGYNYTFTASAEQNHMKIYGEVKEVNPVYNLTYTWELEGTQVSTLVKWTLKETKEGTHLTIEHSGLANYPSEEMTIKMFDNFSNGWENCAAELDKYLQE